MYKILNFGRYKNKMTLPQVVLHDLDYFFRAIDSHAFSKAGFLEAETSPEKRVISKFRSPMPKTGPSNMTTSPVLRSFAALDLCKVPRL